MDRETLMKQRVLCVIDNCYICRLYREFIERMNLKLPYDKQIEILNFTAYFDYGLLTDSRIRMFLPYLQSGQFPVLFFMGMRLDGATTREELESFMKTLLQNDFKYEEYNEFLYQKDCQFVDNKYFGRTLVCN